VVWSGLVWSGGVVVWCGVEWVWQALGGGKVTRTLEMCYKFTLTLAVCVGVAVCVWCVWRCSQRQVPHLSGLARRVRLPVVRVHACVHACVYGWMDGWMDGWMCVCMYVWMDGWMDGEKSQDQVPCDVW